MRHRIVVLGAGYAGLPAARRLARRLHRNDVAVTPVNASDRFAERGRLHQLAPGQRLTALPLQLQLSGAPVLRVVGHVTAIDTTDRAAHMGDEPRAIGYDTLVYATRGQPGTA